VANGLYVYTLSVLGLMFAFTNMYLMNKMIGSSAEIVTWMLTLLTFATFIGVCGLLIYCRAKQLMTTGEMIGYSVLTLVTGVISGFITLFAQLY